MAKHFRANSVSDSRIRSGGTVTAELAPELEARLAAVEVHGAGADFDRASWVWMLLLGVALPAVLLALGWWL
jgi:hypothetical protein